jgi:dienelactone hydrolase
MNVATNLLRAALIAWLANGVAQTAFAQDQIEIIQLQSLTFPGSVFTSLMPSLGEGKPVTVFGMLRMPAGTERVPAVILTHGCGGLTGAETNWARSLREFGIATFLVNSFTPRDISQICSGQPSISLASVLTDVYRALDWVAAHPRIDASRIALMGFSFGGRTALWANHLRFQERYGQGSQKFAAFLAFYPASCYIKLADEDRIGEAPIRIFHGTADDWTPINPCRRYIERLRRAGKDAAIFEYPGARHGFDNAYLSQYQLLPGVVNSTNCTFEERNGKLVDESGGLAGFDAPCVIRSASIGYSPNAHRQALADVQYFLVSAFHLK